MEGTALYVAFATVGELHRWALIYRWGPAKLGGMELWLDQRRMLPYDPVVAWTWGTLTAGAHLRGRRRPDNDTWIAACCIHAGLPLLTQNRRDFADFAIHDRLRLLVA